MWRTKYPAFFFLLILMLSSNALPGGKITIAVLDFDAKNISQESAEAVTDLLRTELFNTGRFKVVERQEIQRIIKEQQFQVSGVTDSDQVVEIGRLLNVQAIMVGTVTKLGSTHLINTRLVNVRTGLVVHAESIESTGGEGKLPGAISIMVGYRADLSGGSEEDRVEEERIHGITATLAYTFRNL